MKDFVPWHYLTHRGIKKSPFDPFWYLSRKLAIGACVSLCYVCTLRHTLSYSAICSSLSLITIHPIPVWPTNQFMPFHGVHEVGVCYIAHVFSPCTLYGKNVLPAFQRWLSRAEQPRANLCPVQSAEVKLTEMNTFYNYIHRESSWHSCTAELGFGLWLLNPAMQVPCVKEV